MASEIGADLAAVNDRIKKAAVRAGRPPADIRLIAVSKMHPPEALEQAKESGAAAFGENKVQEAEGKIDRLGRNFAEWHLIGHLQANKVRKAVRLFDLIHTVDSVELAERLERICAEEGRRELPVLIQVDLAGEPNKTGIAEADLRGLADHIENCGHLRLRGLMLLPPHFDDPEKVRPYFRRLRELRDEIVPGGELSMGMSHDLEAAVEEGATMVRVGTAIFGKR